MRYTTKVLVEVEFEHYGEPLNTANSLVVDRLKCPAVKSAEIVKISSNFQLHSEPLQELKEIKNNHVT